MAQVEKCGVCTGRGYISCPICDGKGKIINKEGPLGQYLRWQAKSVEITGDKVVECQTCQGTGRLLCKVCGGAGKIVAEKPGSSEYRSFTLDR